MQALPKIWSAHVYMHFKNMLSNQYQYESDQLNFPAKQNNQKQVASRNLGQIWNVVQQEEENNSCKFEGNEAAGLSRHRTIC